MPRFKLYIEFDGTRYSGWQKQQNAKTIQGTLQIYAEDIFHTHEVDIQGAGRTDGATRLAGTRLTWAHAVGAKDFLVLAGTD